LHGRRAPKLDLVPGEGMLSQKRGDGAAWKSCVRADSVAADAAPNAAIHHRDDRSPAACADIHGTEIYIRAVLDNYAAGKHLVIAGRPLLYADSGIEKCVLIGGACRADGS
jgi:hypothetical protein